MCFKGGDWINQHTLANARQSSIVHGIVIFLYIQVQLLQNKVKICDLH